MANQGYTLLLASTIIIGTAFPVGAQCNRGGGRGTTGGGSARPLSTAGGLMSPLSSQNPLATTAMGSQFPLAYVSYLNQQQQYFANQQRTLQLLRQQRLAGDQVEAAADSTPTQTATESSVNQRREQLRQANALKAIRAAERAITRGDQSVAEKFLHKAMTLSSAESATRSRAETLLESIK